MAIACRQLAADEWPLLQQMRLAALQADPSVFSSNYVKEVAYVEGDWRKILSNPDKAAFVLFDGDKPIGMTGISISEKEAAEKSAHMWGSWIEPAYRGRGLANELYRARIAWARAHPAVDHIINSCRASNLPSFHANQKHGFVFTHVVPDYIWPDGTVEDHPYFRLTL